MGSLNSREYGLVDEVEIYHFGPIQIYQDTYGNKFFTQNFDFIVDPNAEAQFINHLKKKNNLCPYLIQIKNIQLARENSCSNTAKIGVTFQYINNTLQSLINRNHIFNEHQVVKIFNNLLLAIKHLNDNESYHGDICPEFIYINKKNYQQFYQQLGEHSYKIFDSTYFKPFLNGYYRAQKQKTYCAPQILANLSEKRIYPLYNHHIADTFSIGLVVLYCMSLVNPLGAYNRNFDIDFYYIESMFRLAERKGFSQQLISLVRQCLQPRNRPNATQLLYKFEKMHFSEQSQNTLKFSLKKSKKISSKSYFPTSFWHQNINNKKLVKQK